MKDMHGDRISMKEQTILAINFCYPSKQANPDIY